MEINERWIQFSGKTIISDEPDRESNVLIMGEFEHGDKVEKNNQDGSIDVIYKVEPIRIEVRTGDKRLLGKAKRRGSQRLRGALWHEFQRTDQSEEHFEEHYENYISKLIAFLPEVTELLGTRQ